MRLPMPVSGRGMKRSAFALEQSMKKVGFRFHPTDEELISWYLKPKTLGENKNDDEVIGEIDVCKFEPWDLPGLSKSKSDDQVWYFLCPREFYMNSRRSKRRTEAGFWKPTGKKLTIKAWRTKREIGSKKTLVFYQKASPKALRTGWIIHEYEYLPEPNLTIQREFVLIKLKKKDREKSDEGDQGHRMVSNVENQATFDVQEQATPAVQYHSKSDVKDQTTVFVQNQTSCDTQNQATTDILNQAAKDFPNQVNQDSYCQDTYCFGGQSGCRPSKFQAHNLGAQFINSAENQSEGSLSFSSDLLNQLLDEYIPNSDSYSMAFDSNNQNPSEFRDGWIPSMETPPASNFLMASISPYKSLHKDYPNGPMASISQYQSSYHKDFSSHLIPSLSQCQDKEADMSASREGEWVMPLALSSEIGIEKSHTKSDMSVLEQGNWHFGVHNPHTNYNVPILELSNQHSSMAYFPESDVPQKEAMSPELSPELWAEFTGDDMDLPLYYFENQTPSDNNEVSCPRDSGFVYQSPYSNGVSSSLNATDIENRNKDKIADVSASRESEKNSLVAAPLDSEPQNACMSDLLAAGGNCWSPLMASLSENVEQGGIVLTEEQSQQLEWETFLELQNCLNSNVVLQSTSTEEVPSDNGTDSSVCT